MENKEIVLSVKNLAISFKTDRGIVHAVRGVSFDLYKGETLCIVGESGSGKSVTNKAIMGISAANAIVENGSIMYEGEDLVRVSEEEFHRIRGHKIGMIFQDPLSALNPVMKIGKQITEATLINKNILKRHYSQLISQDLIKYRNCITNFYFDREKIDTELKTIQDYFKKMSKNSNESFESDIHKYIEDLKVKSRNELERLDEVNKSLQATFDSFKNKGIDSKANIVNLQIEENNEQKKLLNDFENFISSNENDIKNVLDTRKKYLINQKHVLTTYFKKIKPLLKIELSNRKKTAKVENKKYYLDLKQSHLQKVEELNFKKEELRKEFENYKKTLNTDELAKVSEIEIHNSIALKKLNKIKKKTEDKNISKTSKDESLTILKTGIEKYDFYSDELMKVENDIDKENQSFINSTKITKSEAKRMALKVMKEVGIPLPEKRFKQYPFEFSGGMRQRIVIAIALTADPEILICDEPTTALDVTIQAQILELINHLKEERHLSCIFITHDLGVVANMADRVAVMYAGKIVEYGLAEEIFFDPKHPYTWALLSSIPDVDSKEKLEAIPGTPPDMLTPPTGDAFALRSKYAMGIDFKYNPPFFKVSDTHYAATWLLYPGAPKVDMPAIVKTRIENAIKKHNAKDGTMKGGEHSEQTN